MIDKASGEIRFNSLHITPAVTRSEFLGCLAEADVSSLVDNPPYRSYSTRVSDAKGAAFSLAAYFMDEELTMLTISVIEDRFGSSWDDWSKEKEFERQETHSRWLETECGMAPGEEFPWGTVASSYDDKAGFSSIVVRYEDVSAPYPHA